MAHGEYRTFVKLGILPRWVLRTLQAGMKKTSGKKPTAGDVISMVLLDYWDGLEKDLSPEQMEELMKLAPPRKKLEPWRPIEGSS